MYSAAPVPRDALTDECEILVVGAGFGGLLLWHKLSQAGFTDVRFCEKGGDVGGTWYWNRYPGIACDVESYSYFPLLEEMGYFPTMKFASGFEIFEYCQKMAEKFGFYDHCVFHTTVEKTEWDEDAGRWIVSTDRGDAIGLLELALARIPSSQEVADICSAAHALAYILIAARRHTDVFEWGMRSTPFSLAAEIQRLPGVADVYIPQDVDYPALRLDVNRTRARCIR